MSSTQQKTLPPQTKVETKTPLRINPSRKSKTIAEQRIIEENKKWLEMQNAKQSKRSDVHLVLPKASRDHDGDDQVSDKSTDHMDNPRTSMNTDNDDSEENDDEYVPSDHDDDSDNSADSEESDNDNSIDDTDDTDANRE
jgi:hypothetical protein